jgi:beta-glucanase (GH16 family)
MKRIIFLFSTVFLFLSIKAQVMWQISEDTVITWNYADGDEFNDKKIDTDKWKYSYGWGRTIFANKEQQYYTEGNNHFLNGRTLILTSKKEKIEARIVDYLNDNDSIKNNDKFYSFNKTSFEYTSGMIQSIKKFNKGYFECRIKLPKQEGYWPAFWLYGGTPNEEIDMLEGKTERKNQIHIDTHCPNRCDLVKLFLQKKSYGGWVKTDYDFTEGFNIIACDWESEKIKFYLNGECIGVANVKFSEEKNLVFNIAVPSDDGPFHPGPSLKDTTVAKLEIDYVRVWSKDFAGNQNDKSNNKTLAKNNIEESAPVLVTSKFRSKGKMTYGKKNEHKKQSVFITCMDYENILELYSTGVYEKEQPQITITDDAGMEVFSGTAGKQIFTISKKTLKSGNYLLSIKISGKTVSKKFIVN